MSAHSNGSKGNVALYATCLVEFFRPSVALAATALLEEAGYRVSIPPDQTCCGQPAYNNGDDGQAAMLARQAIRQLQGYDYVVLPSGSCASTLIHSYPKLLAGDPEWEQAAEELAGRSWELTRFLVEVAGFAPQRPAASACRITYHDSCSGLRQLGIREQPRRLLRGVAGLELAELADAETCCGFGGTFCVKYPDISQRLVDDKVAQIRDTEAELLLGGDLGCLLNIAGRMHRLGVNVRAMHVAEVLAGMVDIPAIGEGRD